MILQEKVLIEYIKENQEKFYRLVYSYTRDEEASLDVIQEAITKALENIDKLKKKEFVKTWFYRILINESLQCIKRNKKRNERDLKEEQESTTSHEEDITENLTVYHAVQSLNKKLRIVIQLRYFENMKIEEIAQITNTNINTVKSRLYKGLKELKEKMEKERDF